MLHAHAVYIYVRIKSPVLKNLSFHLTRILAMFPRLSLLIHPSSVMYPTLPISKAYMLILSLTVNSEARIFSLLFYKMLCRISTCVCYLFLSISNMPFLHLELDGACIIYNTLATLLPQIQVLRYSSYAKNNQRIVHINLVTYMQSNYFLLSLYLM